MDIYEELAQAMAQSLSPLAAADLLLFPSAWVDREDTLPATLRTLAARFDVAIANANWGPGVVRVSGQGGSRIVAAGGRTVAVVAAGARRADAVIEPAPRGA